MFNESTLAPGVGMKHLPPGPDAPADLQPVQQAFSRLERANQQNMALVQDLAKRLEGFLVPSQEEPDETGRVDRDGVRPISSPLVIQIHNNAAGVELVNALLRDIHQRLQC